MAESLYTHRVIFPDEKFIDLELKGGSSDQELDRHQVNEIIRGNDDFAEETGYHEIPEGSTVEKL